MKRIKLFVLVLCLLSVPFLGIGQTKQDSLDVKKAALNYLEGWYEGNAKRMEAALHPELLKRTFVPLPNTGKLISNAATANNMIEYTRAGFGKQSASKAGELKVRIFDIHNNMASAIATSDEYYDYLHLIKVDDEWKIVNVLWHSKPRK